MFPRPLRRLSVFICIFFGLNFIVFMLSTEFQKMGRRRSREYDVHWSGEKSQEEENDDDLEEWENNYSDYASSDITNLYDANKNKSLIFNGDHYESNSSFKEQSRAGTASDVSINDDSDEDNQGEDKNGDNDIFKAIEHGDKDALQPTEDDDIDEDNDDEESNKTKKDEYVKDNYLNVLERENDEPSDMKNNSVRMKDDLSIKQINNKTINYKYKVEINNSVLEPPVKNNLIEINGKEEDLDNKRKKREINKMENSLENIDINKYEDTNEKHNGNEIDPLTIYKVKYDEDKNYHQDNTKDSSEGDQESEYMINDGTNQSNHATSREHNDVAVGANIYDNNQNKQHINSKNGNQNGSNNDAQDANVKKEIEYDDDKNDNNFDPKSKSDYNDGGNKHRNNQEISREDVQGNSHKNYENKGGNQDDSNEEEDSHNENSDDPDIINKKEQDDDVGNGNEFDDNDNVDKNYDSSEKSLNVNNNEDEDDEDGGKKDTEYTDYEILFAEPMISNQKR